MISYGYCCTGERFGPTISCFITNRVSLLKKITDLFSILNDNCFKIGDAGKRHVYNFLFKKSSMYVKKYELDSLKCLCTSICTFVNIFVLKRMYHWYGLKKLNIHLCLCKTLRVSVFSVLIESNRLSNYNYTSKQTVSNETTITSEQ